MPRQAAGGLAQIGQIAIPVAELDRAVVFYRDIDASHELFVSHGVEFEAPPHRVAKLSDHELWMAFFRNPDRNLLASMCEVRP